MQSFLTLIVAAVAAATPIAPSQPSLDLEHFAQLEARGTGVVSKEFTEGGCRDYIFFFARGTSELGNMGQSSGPALADGLKAVFGDSKVAAEGVDYAAAIITNLNPGGADFLGIAEMQRLLKLASKNCPDSKLIASGYSQGAALVHRAVEKMPANVLNQIMAAVTFGDSQNKQDGGRIRNYDPSKTLIICNSDDDICKGTLIVKPTHLDYVRRVPEAVSFIASLAS